MLNKGDVVLMLLDKFEKGLNIELVCNVLIYADFSKWESGWNKKLVTMIKNIQHESDENNKMLLTSNTLMVLAHCKEFLYLIGKNVKLLRRSTKQILDRFELLACKVIDNIEMEYIETYFLDRDFRDRTLLKIVTMYNFKGFLHSNKTTILLDSIWQGMNTSDCDGRVDDFSLMHFLYKSKTHYIEGKKMSYVDMITNNFVTSYDKISFWFQYKFRRESVAYNFVKDFLCAIGLLIAFQYINFQYLSLFKRNNYEDLPTEQMQLDYIQEKIDEYNGYNFIGTILALTLLYSYFGRLFFNFKSRENIPYDKWLMIDLTTSLISIVCFNYTGNLTPEQILDISQKQRIDYYVALVVVVAWLRCFSYFLIIRPISKLLMTLMRMLKDTFSFLFIIICYLLLMSTIFTTIYQGIDEVRYGSMSTTFRTLFDDMLANYEREPVSASDNLHSILHITHVIISNIFLLNFLIAILSTVYSYMKEEGNFRYKANIYSYIEKYQTARLDKEGLEELVVHPAPLNVLSMVLIPFYFKYGGEKYAEAFSKVIYWLENLVILSLFLTYLMVIIPIIFFKMLLHLLQGSKWYRTPYIMISWLVAGGLLLPLYGLKD
jgi:hypothetical protein